MSRTLLAMLALTASLAEAAKCDELPAILIVQDRSFSMSRTTKGEDIPPATDPSKWSISQQVVPQIAFDFENRIRFGVMFYPEASNECGTGTVVSPISYNASNVQAAYTGPTAVPFGLTPSAASLDAARAYLEGLHLTTPKYVLLITDGIPNCIGPDPDAVTVAAAKRLKDAGILVGVVGFGAQFAGGNDKDVLDRIAAAGGTGAAYAATNHEQLRSQLNLIASSASGCCRDVCSAGAAQCNGSGQSQKCEVNAAQGCTQWVSIDCAAGAVCTDGHCRSCTDACSNGSTRCNGASVETCEVGASGCLQWSAPKTCGPDKICSNGACAGCSNACTDGEKRCGVGGVIEECRRDATGCLSFSPVAQCNLSAGGTCVNGVCTGACTDVCTEGLAMCSIHRPQSCVRQSNGCTAWSSGTECTAQTICSEGGCRQRCPVDELETCPAGTMCKLIGIDRLCMPATDAGVDPPGSDGDRKTPANPDAGLLDGSSAKSANNLGASGACSSSPLILSCWALAMAAIMLRLRSNR